MNKPPLIALVGPTAVGKTAVGIALANALSGEIVSADSRQIYVGLDIGTAKPTTNEQAQIRHHLIDVVPPTETLSLAEFQRMAYAAINDIHARGKLPLLVGGSGQHVHAVLYGWNVPEVAPDWQLRDALEQEAANFGAEALHARLQELDPQGAAKIDARNVRRVVRALEICLKTGRQLSEVQTQKPPPYRVLCIGLTRPTEILYARVDARIDNMIEQGLVEEVRNLIKNGVPPRQPALSGVGYQEIVRHLTGEITLNEAIVEIKRNTRRLVRQQRNWFRATDPQINWYAPEPIEHIVAEIQRWLNDNGSENERIKNA